MALARKRKVAPNEPDQTSKFIRQEPTVVDYEKNFSILDILRVLGGLIVLNFVISYYITGTLLWGSQTRLTNPRYLKHIVFEGERNFTESELAKYNGHDPNLPIYVAVAGRVYDVSSNPRSYGPIGSYSFFAGTDAARAFVTGCFQQDLTHDLRGLDPVNSQAEIESWQRFFENNPKYWFVGHVIHPPLTGPVPDPCYKGKAPHNYHPKK